MIYPGWLPGRARSPGRRTLPYTRGRRRRTPKPARRPITVDTEPMLFDQVGELPVATVRRAPGSRVELLASDFARWVTARWRWFKPRTIPMTVAFLGMLAVIHAVHYLSHPPAASPPSASIRIDHRTAGAMIFVDGKPYQDGARLPDLESTGYRVRLVLQP